MYSSIRNLSNWLAVFHTHGVGPAKFQEYLAVDPMLHKLPYGIQTDWRKVETDLVWLKQHSDASIVTLVDHSYPMLLKQIANPPPLLYVLGDKNTLASQQIAMVGSRNPSVYGLQCAGRFAHDLATLGLTITSGMAQGIDGASHKAALAAGSKTIAVLGCGINIVYPLRHRELAAQIMQNGCLVSEFPLSTGPEAYNFPRRNRIISGLSLGVLVVEATLKSGSLITAAYALEQNREIFAIPGAITNLKMLGCHKLIRQGAKLVQDVSDILEELEPLLRNSIRGRNAAAGITNVSAPEISSSLRSILDKIDYEPTCVDIIVSRSALQASVVGAVLLELELHNFISAVPGGYVRN